MAKDQSAANGVSRQGLPKLGSTMPSRIEVVLNVDKLDRDLVEIYGLLETPTESAVKQVSLWLIKRTDYGGHCRRNDRLLSKGWRKGAIDGIDDFRVPHWNVSQAIHPVGIPTELKPEFRRRMADVLRSLLVFVRRSFNYDVLRSDHAADARAKIAHYFRLRRIDASIDSEPATHPASDDPFRLLWGTALKGRELEYMGVLWNRETNQPVKGVTFELICRDVYEANDRERPLVSSVERILRDIHNVLVGRHKHRHEVVIGGTPNDGYNRPVEIRPLPPS